MSYSPRPKRLALTLGDPAGVGPELALRVADQWSREDASLYLIGSADIARRVCTQLNYHCPAIREPHDAIATPGVSLIEVGTLDPQQVVPGQWNAATGRASYDWVCYAIEQTRTKQFDALVTGPIQKEAWHAAGIAYPGHTELLADRLNCENYRMMLTAPEISCVLVTIHIPLQDVAASLTIDGIYQSIELAAEAMQRRHKRPARITVCGLNPHAGEHGLFSHQEEERLIAPAIERARAAGLQVRGPLPPDTAFVPALRRETDAYVCMYHDQGLIPLKALAFDEAVNVTLGTPIVRTSVDHGTAMDIAWQGIANDASLRAAIDMAIDLS